MMLSILNSWKCVQFFYKERGEKKVLKWIVMEMKDGTFVDDENKTLLHKI